ncbi:hypothetical protein NPA31_002535 [Aurantimonas sp. MSK8Z-1]|uniref:hypothetical protein n=1 Tax=Mangrovibrevibacter kandeliae TaxID=2968473 RepID=UPI0021196F92|nr:hypothetical protein [Aurantimonas sp. MSK8Z-1]MCW4113841.1 hypothetical protein [Aurantimonas sp. MSK8Z-1]
MTAGQSELGRLEDRLRQAAKRHAASLREAEAASRSAAQLSSAFLRLGLNIGEIGRLDLRQGSDRVPAALREELQTRAAADLRRLLRLARAGHPAYDLNRHIAARRLLAWLAGGTGTAKGKATLAPRSEDGLATRTPPRRRRRGEGLVAGFKHGKIASK